MTWMLWKALRYPQWKHPVFHYARQGKNRRIQLAPIFYLVLVLLALGFAGFAAFFPIPALLSLFGLAFAIPALILVFNGTVLGLYWVGAIAEALAREFRTGRSDLLSLTPEGAFGANWRLAMGTIHRHDWLNTVYRLIKTTALIVLVLLLFGSVMLFAGAFVPELGAQRESQIRIFVDILGIVLTVLFFWADHIQSIVIALLLGLILPWYQRSELLLRVLAPLVFLLFQCLTYLLGYGIYVIAHLLVKDAVLWVALTALIIFCSLREFLIRGFWQHYLKLTQATEETTIVRL